KETSEFLLTGNQTMKGIPDEKEIHVYETDETLSKGEQYLLFLSRFEGGLYPTPIYTSIDKENIIHIKNDVISPDTPILKSGVKINNVINEITNSPFIDVKATHIATLPQIMESSNTEELSTSADIISHIIP